jgi:hypothetical protein
LRPHAAPLRAEAVATVGIVIVSHSLKVRRVLPIW